MIPSLWLITPPARLADEAGWAHLEAALAGGVDAVLVRAPKMPASALLALASRLRALTRHHKAELWIHSRFEIAEAVGADGVHLAARTGRMLAEQGFRAHKEARLSMAVHDAEELTIAERLGCALVFLSPVFPTPSHPGAPALGIGRFRRLAEAAGLPVVALGGITPENRPALAGFPVAVLSAIWDAPDPQMAAQMLSLAASPPAGT